jgi:hypothetical protein
VRLTVDGKSYTQPLTLRLDPRVKTPAAALTQVVTLTREMYEGARAAHTAFTEARALVARLDALQGNDINAFKAQVESLAPAPAAGGRGGRGGRGGGGRGGPPVVAVEGAGRGGRGGTAPAGPATLEGVSAAMLAAAMAMQNAEVAPTANEVAACARARSEWSAALARWTALKTTRLAALNAKRKAAGLPEVRSSG